MDENDKKITAIEDKKSIHIAKPIAENAKQNDEIKNNDS